MNTPSKASKATPKQPYRGQLGKTQRQRLCVAASDGSSFTASVYTQINASTHPELRESLLNGTLYEIQDPSDGQTYSLAFPVVYHDPELRFFALILPNCLRHQEFVHVRSMLASFEEHAEPLPSYVRAHRVVWGHEALSQVLETPGTLTTPTAQAEETVEEIVASPSTPPPTPPIPTTATPPTVPPIVASPTPPPEIPATHTVLSPPPTQPPTPSPRPVDDSPTMVVSRDMILGDAAQDGWDLESAPILPSVVDLVVSSKPSPAKQTIPETFDLLNAIHSSHYHDPTLDPPTLSFLLTDERLDAFLVHDLDILIQLHELPTYPLVSILIVAKDAEKVPVDTLFMPLDVRRKHDADLLQALRDKFKLVVALYSKNERLAGTFPFSVPLQLNTRHILKRAEEILETRQENDSPISFADAVEYTQSADFQALGELQHNFHIRSFMSINSPSEARLAAGIVAYWSTQETQRYLIENRSFSLGIFSQIQERVVTSSVRFGICLSKELRAIAAGMMIAPNEVALLESLASTWAQITLGVGQTRNDLDPIGTWENWQDFIEALDALDARLDPDLNEMAQKALRDARAYAQEHGLMDPAPQHASPPPIPTTKSTEDSLHDLSAEELKELLAERERRLSAAQRLLSDMDSSYLLDVLLCAEQMDDDELDPLSLSLTTHAKRHEDALIDALELNNPTIAMLACMALSSIPSAKARKPLLRAIQDPNRAPDPSLFAASMTSYGIALVKDLKTSLRKHSSKLNEEHPLIILLAVLVTTEGEGALDKLKKSSPKAVRLARRAAKNLPSEEDEEM